MTEHERAKEAMVKAGYVQGVGFGGNYFVNISERGVDKVWLRENSFKLETDRQLKDLPGLLSPALTEEEHKALDVCATALELLASPGVQMSLRHARKHMETVGLDADDYYNVTEAYAEWDHTHADTLRSILSRYGGATPGNV